MEAPRRVDGKEGWALGVMEGASERAVTVDSRWPVTGCDWMTGQFWNIKGASWEGTGDLTWSIPYFILRAKLRI